MLNSKGAETMIDNTGAIEVRMGSITYAKFWLNMHASFFAEQLSKIDGCRDVPVEIWYNGQPEWVWVNGVESLHPDYPHQHKAAA